MYFPTCSASFLVLALTLLWTEKPECRQAAILSTDASEMSSWRRKRAKTSRLKKLARRLSWEEAR